MAPALRFALLGAALFALAQIAGPPRQRIALSPALLDGLAQDHLRRTGQPPTAGERQALIDRYVEQEALYREALALGLDRGDVIVRRRLVQKMQFVLEGESEPGAPRAAQLDAFFAADPARWTRPAQLDLVQVFVDRRRRGAAAAADADALRARLAGGADPATLGDPYLHGAELRGRSASDLTALFGAETAAALFALPPGQWSAPLASPHGLHLMKVVAHRPAEVPPLDAVRAEVLAAWRDAERARRTARAIARLRDRYAVAGQEAR